MDNQSILDEAIIYKLREIYSLNEKQRIFILAFIRAIDQFSPEGIAGMQGRRLGDTMNGALFCLQLMENFKAPIGAEEVRVGLTKFIEATGGNRLHQLIDLFKPVGEKKDHSSN